MLARRADAARPFRWYPAEVVDPTFSEVRGPRSVWYSPVPMADVALTAKRSPRSGEVLRWYEETNWNGGNRKPPLDNYGLLTTEAIGGLDGPLATQNTKGMKSRVCAMYSR
jgi:hypothetical protein